MLCNVILASNLLMYTYFIILQFNSALKQVKLLLPNEIS